MPIHLRGAVREFNEEINAVRRELNRLEEAKILLTEKRGNRKYFVLNQSRYRLQRYPKSLVSRQPYRSLNTPASCTNLVSDTPL